MNRDPKSASVPEGDKQVEEDLWQRHGAERGVWSEPMLTALERGIEGNKWFSLIDKVRSERTLGKAWEKVRTNAGACGVDFDQRGVLHQRQPKSAACREGAISLHISHGGSRGLDFDPAAAGLRWFS